MQRIHARSPHAVAAADLTRELQRYFVDQLEEVTGARSSFAPIEWFRDEGRHGGGLRYAAAGTPAFNRASVNVSGVHYDDEPDRKLSSATALSTIIHPAAPRAPSIHMHISWTEMRDGRGYWRVMADLNPAIEDAEATSAFRAALKTAAPAVYDEASAQGDRYFFIPALGRHRGVAHFYLEGYSTGDFAADAAFARAFGRAAVDCYVRLLGAALAANPTSTEEERQAQLAYHTLYLLQVLTLDRGTTSGLLVHDQNDVGILGSLPAFVDRQLLASWEPKLSPPQDALLRGIVGALPDASPSPVTEEVRQALAHVVRDHYRAHPEALALQASGDVIPPTVANHLARG